MHLIRTFLDAVLPLRNTRTLAHQATIETLGAYATSASVMLHGREIRFLLPYHVPLVRSVIVEAKFYTYSDAHKQLGLLLAEHLLSYSEEEVFGTHTYVLVPVPLSKKRHRERGYNQVELVLRNALIHLPNTFTIDTRLIQRTRDTAPQTKLGRNARHKNMEGAFRCVGTLNLSATYIVVDDVVTTGATLCAVLKVLPPTSIGISLAH